ncbi:hypothetical protein RRF57_010462 [Xylaria bambusicola]|uniref:HTH La-type RNA-binding domain-containing protein n=1 Tax=Xylaria bambusicola TaxID=326684 RepID=A0AAN7UV18_9PEZI
MSSQQTGENVKNSDSYKDIRTQTHKEHHTQNQNGSNHRGNERGRGAGRGRGGFSLNANGMSHYAQNPYVAQHHTYQFPSGNPRHGNHYSASYQPVSYSYSAQSGPGQRKPTNGNRRQGGGRVPAMAPMNIPYDPTIYHAHNGGIFPYESGNLLQLAQQQVEYYFSVNNIVKDLFLRRHMDSQGFVPISVIASFNRMKELLVDLNILRQACIDSVLLELVMGNDGVERVRSKEGWDKWVLKDMSERHPSARHEGPASWQPFSNGFQHPMMSPQYPVETPPMFSPTSEHGFAHYPNGNYGPPMSMAAVNGSIAYTRPQESQLSAAVPEFSPSNTSTFNGVKSPSVNGGEDKKAVAHAEVNGVPPSHEQPHSLTNGTILGQPQALVDNSHLANGVGLAH